MSGRWVCRDAGHVYNESTNPPRSPGRCDIDGSALIQREDDKPDTVRARLDLQLASLREVIDHYAATGHPPRRRRAAVDRRRSPTTCSPPSTATDGADA